MTVPDGAQPPTQPERPTPSAGRPPSRHVKVALVLGSGVRLTTEIETLLRGRLRVMVLIALLPAVGMFALDIFDTRRGGPDFLLYALQTAMIVVLLALAALLFSRRPLTHRQLRLAELTLLASVVTLFCYLQWQALAYETAPGRAGAAPTASRFTSAETTIRWALFLVFYGTFVPNSGRRCAAVVAVLALLPVALNLTFGLASGRPAPPGGWVRPDLCIPLAVAAAIAVFGSYRISSLQEQAAEARQLGQYRLLRELGRGGMGAVYLAEHTLLRRPCAVKLIRPEQAGDPNTLARFEREVRATAKLTHPNTVEVYDYGHAEDGTFYYVMEYLPGLSLQELVSRHGPLPPARVVHLFRQVCQALREAHAAGLLHRDLKPGNLLVCERGRVCDVAKL